MFPEFLAIAIEGMGYVSEVNKMCMNLTPDDSPLLLYFLHLEVQGKQASNLNQASEPHEPHFCPFFPYPTPQIAPDLCLPTTVAT